MPSYLNLTMTTLLFKQEVPVIRTYPNQKTWITGNIRAGLKARATPYKERDTDMGAYKKSRNDIRRDIEKCKRKKLTEWSEESIQVSEFTVKGERDKINLSDLIGTLGKTPSALMKTKKQLKNLQHNQSTLETPLTRK
ncbi:uncharacterized protein ACWYII_002290 isoform 1-T2 [Salvelinus alpinus]